jgi:trehalose/maltose hydrolase-like predicted phosphorylase
VVDLLQRGYTGIVTRGEALWLNPRLPEELERLELTVRYRGHTLDLRVTREAIEVHARPSDAAPIQIGIAGDVHELAAGRRRRFPLAGAAR